MNKLNLPKGDIGIDIIVETNDLKYIAIQVKFRSNRYEAVNYSELATFISTTFGIANNIHLAYYFSNTYPVNRHVAKAKIIPVLGQFFDDLPENFFIDVPYKRGNN